MSRNFGIMSGRPDPWGHSGIEPSASIGRYAPSNSNLLPAQSILHSEDISDADREVASALFAFASFAAPLVIFGFGLIFYVLFFA